MAADGFDRRRCITATASAGSACRQHRRNPMENLIIGALAGLIIFALFFIVFMLRERGSKARGRHHGCGQPDGPCRCRQADASIQPFPPPE